MCQSFGEWSVMCAWFKTVIMGGMSDGVFCQWNQKWQKCFIVLHFVIEMKIKIKINTKDKNDIKSNDISIGMKVWDTKFGTWCCHLFGKHWCHLYLLISIICVVGKYAVVVVVPVSVNSVLIIYEIYTWISMIYEPVTKDEIINTTHFSWLKLEMWLKLTL